MFVEKPLALTDGATGRCLHTVDATGNDRLMVGFNRRFAPMLTEMRTRFGLPRGSSIARYLVNAGTLSADSWYGNEDLEGTRFAGEGGHFIDTLRGGSAVTRSRSPPWPVATTRDLHVVLRYADGSLASITYVTNGHARFPKETFEASSGGRSARLDNFKRATVWSGRRRRSNRALGAPNKGQRAEIDAFLKARSTGGPMPISLSSLAATTRATLAAATSITTGTAVRI